MNGQPTATATPSAPAASAAPGSGVKPPASAGPAEVKKGKLDALKTITGAKPADGPAPKVPGATEVTTAAEEGQDANQQQQAGPKKDAAEEELSNLLPSEADLLDISSAVVEVDGVKVPWDKVMQDATFEVPFKKGFKTVKGLDDLKKMAAIGFGATESNSRAKQALQEAGQIIQQQEQQLPSLVQKGLREATEARFVKWEKGILEGKFPNGQPIKTTQQMSQAVADLKNLKDWFMEGLEGPSSSQPASQTQNMTMEQLEKKLRDEFAKQLEEERRKNDTSAKSKLAAEKTLGVLTEVLQPYGQKFLKEDGKTVNARLYDNFVRDTQLAAANMAEQLRDRFPQGIPLDMQKAIIGRAAQEVIKDYGLVTPKAASNKGQGAPPIKPGTGTPAPNGAPKKPAGKSALFGTPEWFKEKRRLMGMK